MLKNGEVSKGTVGVTWCLQQPFIRGRSTDMAMLRQTRGPAASQPYCQLWAGVAAGRDKVPQQVRMGAGSGGQDQPCSCGYFCAFL